MERYPRESRGRLSFQTRMSPFRRADSTEVPPESLTTDGRDSGRTSVTSISSVHGRHSITHPVFSGSFSSRRPGSITIFDPLSPQTPSPLYTKPRPIVLKDYKIKASMVCGVIQIVLGVAAVDLAIAAVAIWEDTYFSRASVGVWGGILFIITGSFGVVSALTKYKHQIRTCMILSMISSIVAGLLVAFSFYTLVRNINLFHKRKGFFIVLCMLMSVAFVELVVGVVQSVLCCLVTCCGARLPPDVETLYSPVSHNPRRQLPTPDRLSQTETNLDCACNQTRKF